MPKHTCHAVDCPVVVPPKMLMCRTHWGFLSHRLKAAVWRAYEPGQEVTKDPSPLYMLVQRLAVAEVAVRTGKWDTDRAVQGIQQSWELWIGGITDEERGWYVGLLPGGDELLEKLREGA